jgi:hypothetical protein
LDVRSSVIYNDEPDKLVAVLGVDDLIVVNTKEAVLVCRKSDAQRVKQLLKLLAGG